MKNKIILLPLLATAIMLSLMGCQTNAVIAPGNRVPKRSALAYDAYGGLITLQTNDSRTYTGELIGIRNDTVIVLSEVVGISSIFHKDILTARVIVYNPNLYNGAYAMMVPNVLLLVHIGEFAGSPLVFSLFTSAINLAGIAVAKKTEMNKINYYDWGDGWKEITKHSRFPGGVPPHLLLSNIKGRPPIVTKKK